MNLLIDALTYIIVGVIIIIAVRYRNYIDWFYLIYLFGMAVGGISSIMNHFLLGMLICDICAVIGIFFAIWQTKERISRKTDL
ncbi:hypothetical protein IIU_06046 [Bacillus cereus VD133]|uniref:Uncharacterized protein n=1 Tax=Bacillus cereus VD133 TaxID=1053233 RepID=A0A9W5PL01_BACCE|nr:hypothetical protein IIU_06046 [Bacillus cereus VD133]